MAEPDYVEQVLADGAVRAATVAEATLKVAKENAGFMMPARRWPVNGSL